MSSFSEGFFTHLLLRRLVTADQLREAQSVCQATGARIEDALVRLGHVTAEDVMMACADAVGLPYLDLTFLVVPPEVVELVPESVARETIIFPVRVGEGRALVIASSDPGDISTLEKLLFILNRPIEFVVATRDQIIDAINRHYGEGETESVDSMLAEFTDTAIDFTEVESAGVDLDLALPQASPRADRMPAGAPARLNRHATVRYYSRMNPERMFPLLVVLSASEVKQVAQRGVAQAKSETFQVDEGSLVEVEPILPGCACFPPRETVRVKGAEVTATFWVVPHVLGKVMDARVVVRQEGATLAQVPLEIRIGRQTLTAAMGGLSLVLPFGLLLLKHFELDFETQLKGGFGLYAQLAGWLIQSLTPEVLTGLLAAATVGLYLAFRPRRRDVFFDVHFEKPAEPAPAAVPRPVKKSQVAAPAETFDHAALLVQADRSYNAGDHQAALWQYQRALALGPLQARHYFRASLSAAHLGDNARALQILDQARLLLPPGQMTGQLWFNMGCFAARLGKHREAMNHLNQAVDAGWKDPRKYQEDSDLEPLRWRPEFKRLLAELAQ